jgi:putative NADH-flavin reductase
VNFLVFGASGRTGSAFVRQALAAGHAVRAFVRDGAAEVPKGATIATGDVLASKSVESAVSGASGHAIVIALGGIDALTKGSANVIAAASASGDGGAKRVLGVVGAGVLQADATTLRNQLPNYPAQLRPIGTAHHAFYDALRASPLEWTLACTPRLALGERTDAMKALADYLPDGSGSVTTEDVAAFLLDAAVHSKFVHARVGLNG